MNSLLFNVYEERIQTSSKPYLYVLHLLGFWGLEDTLDVHSGTVKLNDKSNDRGGRFSWIRIEPRLHGGVQLFLTRFNYT